MENEAKPAAGPKVLIVDDEEDILLAFSISLRKAGFEVQTAESGNKALGLMEHWLQIGRAHV
jgi:CheY-like chemotaxis protein